MRGREQLRAILGKRNNVDSHCERPLHEVFKRDPDIPVELLAHSFRLIAHGFCEVSPCLAAMTEGCRDRTADPMLEVRQGDLRFLGGEVPLPQRV